ncbi:chromate reductase [Humitalea rosea]|uniref:Chromate reductase n=1 Tax=Humitalea rosea TaxID=990373 RepID=A0A2W7IDY0_9PROT|nr:NAD(P)H-dependent oxidoreductase [Humitalea rosea]PZW45100.1 chromate reductase [Humitalea rosea]
MTQPYRLLGLCGSLRRASGNRAVLLALRAALAPRAELTIFPLDEIPPYNEDDDVAPPPPAVAALRQALADSDGAIIASPEYNHGMSGVLKNALDWASRPYGQSHLTGLPVLTLTASPAFTGGVRAQQQVNETLAAVQARIVRRPQLVIGGIHEKLGEGVLTDAATLRFVLAGVEDLLAEVDHLQHRHALA